jgi:acyl-CoA thioesterase I
MRSSAILLAATSVSVCIAACGPRQDSPGSPPPQTTSSPAAAGAADTAAAAPRASRPRIVILGDSLTAGLGLAPSEAYPTLLQQRLTDAGMNYEVVNAGVSGDTSAGGLSRLDWALEGDVRFLVVALGGNDALRGLPPDGLKRNLAQIIERAQARHITVVLAGMEAPPNYGVDYARQFHDVYAQLARQYDVPLVPFLLQGVGGVARLNQPDGIHPTAEGARTLADNVWTVLKPLVESHGS